MNVSPDALRKETVQLLKQVNAQIEELNKMAEQMSVPPEKVHDHNGGWALTPLLMAKAQCLHTLVLLNEK